MDSISDLLEKPILQKTNFHFVWMAIFKKLYSKALFISCLSTVLFLEKKGCGLPPFIGYRGLNQISVKYQYILSLVLSALEQLRLVTIFTKLDPGYAYNHASERR